MELGMGGSERRLWDACEIIIPKIFVKLWGHGGYLIEEFRVLDVDLPGIDTNNGTCDSQC